VQDVGQEHEIVALAEFDLIVVSILKENPVLHFGVLDELSRDPDWNLKIDDLRVELLVLAGEGEGVRRRTSPDVQHLVDARCANHLDHLRGAATGVVLHREYEVLGLGH
jgi:hypothetical protein